MEANWRREKFHWNINKPQRQRPFKIKEGADLISKSRGKKPKSSIHKNYVKLTKDIWRQRKWNDWPVKCCVHPLTSSQSSRPQRQQPAQSCFQVPPSHIWSSFVTDTRRNGSWLHLVRRWSCCGAEAWGPPRRIQETKETLLLEQKPSRRSLADCWQAEPD